MTAKLLAVHICLASYLLTSRLVGQNYTSVAYSYAGLAFPGAVLTTANGINSHNVVVGSFYDRMYSVHGFVYSKGKYTKVDFPGSSETEVLGINDNGDIVGVYQVSGPLNFHGFLRHNGKFTTIDVPQAQFGTKVFGINNDMEMVGNFDDAEGFILRNGSWTIFNAPQQNGEPPQTQLNGINNLGWISGQVFSVGHWRGFWFRGRDFDFLQPPGSGDNEVTGMNDRGDLLGCHDATSGFVSFRAEAIEASESNERDPMQEKLPFCGSGINYARVIVGNKFHVNQPDAVIAVPQLTLNVVGPPNHSVVGSPVQFSATASGINSVTEIQVWANFTKIASIKGGTLNTRVDLPASPDERVVLQAIDTKGRKTKVVLTLTVE